MRKLLSALVLALALSLTASAGPFAISGGGLTYGKQVGQLTYTAQAANITATTIYTPSANGWYVYCEEMEVTQAATTSSSTPFFQISYTSPVDSVVKFPSNSFGSSSVNTTATGTNGCGIVYAKSGTAIQIATNSYASSGATPMQYAMTVTLFSGNASGT